MHTIATLYAMQEHRDTSGPSVIVPTMGALHAGHEALIRRAAEHAEQRGLSDILVTIFVNPTQFNDPRDFDAYPRDVGDDLAKCEAWGATAAFVPEVNEVYPPGEEVPVGELPAAAVGKGLEDHYRPGHFEGVVRVVRRLFSMCRPAAAIFGEKDWQQLCVVRQMCQRERLGITIVPCETARTSDGLAQSSRNKHLTEADREAALSLSRALLRAQQIADPAEAEAAMRDMMAEAGAAPEYHAIRHAETLEPVTAGDLRTGAPMRALVAARVGTTRLLDNMSWPA